MSSVIKWILVLIVVAGGGWLVWYSGWLNTFLGPKTAVVTTPPVATTTDQTPPQPQTPPMNMNGMSDAKDASDAALVQDTAAVDSQMQGLTTDGTNLSTAINDKPLPQAN